MLVSARLAVRLALRSKGGRAFVAPDRAGVCKLLCQLPPIILHVLTLRHPAHVTFWIERGADKMFVGP